MAALGAIKAGGDPAAAEAALRDTRARAAQIEAEVVARFSAHAEFAVSRPLGVARVQALLSPGEALVMILSGTTGTQVWAISPEAVA